CRCWLYPRADREQAQNTDETMVHCLPPAKPECERCEKFRSDWRSATAVPPADVRGEAAEQAWQRLF
ncbi:MAG TPA: hypothetical protein VEB21_16690, partial [Terriglobales bacterium]|nr:hypothetical protein [Terriglobales bacterium]